MVKRLQSPPDNSLCGNCLRSCKQADTVVLIDCPRFLKRPFKVKVHRYDQLELFAGDKK